MARATVVDTWKGRAANAISFDPSPARTCDTSDGVVGETAVLFLKHCDGRPLLHDVHFGRGRLPLLESREPAIRSAWISVVVFPASIATFPGPEPEFEFIRGVDLDVLRGKGFGRRDSGKEIREKGFGTVSALATRQPAGHDGSQMVYLPAVAFASAGLLIGFPLVSLRRPAGSSSQQKGPRFTEWQRRSCLPGPWTSLRQNTEIAPMLHFFCTLKGR